MATQQNISDVNPDTQTLVKDNTMFAFDLYAQLKSKEGNLFFSPYSISTALAMTYAGARGNTAGQMADVLHFSLELKPLYHAFADLEAHVNAVQEKGNIQLGVANALWAQQDYQFLQEFMDLVIRHYRANLSYADFTTAYEAARREINGWVEHQTCDKIKELLSEGILNTLTRLVLVNAIYFKGNWASQFEKDYTHNAAFWIALDTSVEVSMMTQTHECNHCYIAEDSVQILELPYVGDDLSMIILLPTKNDGLALLENSLNAENLELWLGRLHKLKITVYVPKFKMSSGFRLDKTLKTMGMPDAFSECDANFSGMDGTRELHISAVVHKAFVEVNEEGTEAAAATAVVMSSRSLMQPPAFRADHPFLFLIRDNHSGSILFLGRVIDPTT